jgi:hypothetical protein
MLSPNPHRRINAASRENASFVSVCWMALLFSNVNGRYFIRISQFSGGKLKLPTRGAFFWQALHLCLQDQFRHRVSSAQWHNAARKGKLKMPFKPVGQSQAFAVEVGSQEAHPWVVVSVSSLV